MIGMSSGMIPQPPCPLSPQVMPFWPMLSQMLIQKLNHEAMAGGHGAEFWTACQYNNFQNPVWQQVATEAILTLNQILISNPVAAQNPAQQIEDVARGVSINAAVCWAMQQPHLVSRLAQLPNFTEIQNAVNQYKQGIQSAMTMYNPMQNFFGQQGFGMPNVNMGGNMMNAGMMPGWPGQQNGISPQQQAMMMAMVMGQQGAMGGQFNPNAFNQQMMNNAQYNTMGNNFQQGSTWGQGGGVLNAGRTNTLGASTGGAVWNNQQQPQNQQQQQGVPGANWSANASNASGGFQKVSNFNEQSAIPNNFGQSAAQNSHQTVNQQVAQNAPLQPISGNPNVTTITNENLNQPPRTTVTKIAPTDRRTVIRLSTGQKLIRPLAYNVETHTSVCEVDANNVVIAQRIIPVEKVKEEYGIMDFDKHNTARFFTQRGDISRTMVADPTAVSEAVVGSLKQSYLNSVLEKIAETNDVATLDSATVTKLLRDQTNGNAVVVDKCIQGYHSQYYNDITSYITEKGVDVLVDSQVVSADLIEINTAALTINAQDICEDIRTATDAVSMQNRFTILRKWIGPQQWTLLDNAITQWVNNELYTNFGLGLEIDTFAGDLVELMNVMADKDVSIADRNRLLVNIANKFFTVYKTKNVAGERIDSFDIGEEGVLGTLNRYVFMPVQSVDFQLAGGINCVLISGEAMPELFRLCTGMFTNIPAQCDSTMYNYIVTLDGERLQVNKPYGLPYFTIMRVDATFVNPLIKR